MSGSTDEGIGEVGIEGLAYSEGILQGFKGYSLRLALRTTTGEVGFLLTFKESPDDLDEKAENVVFLPIDPVQAMTISLGLAGLLRVMMSPEDENVTKH